MISDAAQILYLQQRLREVQEENLRLSQCVANQRAALERHPRSEPTHIAELLAPLARRVDRASTAV